MFQFQPSRFRTDSAKVALILSSLTDQALDWAMAAVGSNLTLSSDLAGFSEEFRRAFDHTTGRLHHFQQGLRSIAEYTLEFQTLASDSGWDDNALRSAYRRGLSEEIKDLLIRDRPPTFNCLVTLALQMDESAARTLETRPGGCYGPGERCAAGPPYLMCCCLPR